MLTQDQTAAVSGLLDRNNRFYANLDIDGTLDYMRRRFITPISHHLSIEGATFVDCAAGYGWLSFAFLMAGGRHATLIDPDAPRLNAARDIACVLGLEDRCTFTPGTLQNSCLDTDAFDVFASIETLEHVGCRNITPCLEAIANTARKAVLFTTPNAAFPIVTHDTQLPFAHWLPKRPRRAYARAFGRERLDDANDFVFPWQIGPLAKKFRPVSRVQTFGDIAEFDRFYPHYLPYGSVANLRYRAAAKKGLRVYYSALAAMLGTCAYLLSPNLATIWLRR